MKVLQKGKEVKDATVIFDTQGNPQHVQVKGVNYDLNAFEFEEAKTTKQTKPARTKSTVKKTSKKGLKSRLTGLLSTKDTK